MNAGCKVKPRPRDTVTAHETTGGYTQTRQAPCASPPPVPARVGRCYLTDAVMRYPHEMTADDDTEPCPVEDCENGVVHGRTAFSTSYVCEFCGGDGRVPARLARRYEQSRRRRRSDASEDERFPAGTPG